MRVPEGKHHHPAAVVAAEDFSASVEMDHLQTDHPAPVVNPHVGGPVPAVFGRGRLGSHYNDCHVADLENCCYGDLGNFHFVAGLRDISHLDDLCSHHHCSLYI